MSAQLLLIKLNTTCPFKSKSQSKHTTYLAIFSFRSYILTLLAKKKRVDGRIISCYNIESPRKKCFFLKVKCFSYIFLISCDKNILCCWSLFNDIFWNLGSFTVYFSTIRGFFFPRQIRRRNSFRGKTKPLQ